MNLIWIAVLLHILCCFITLLGIVFEFLRIHKYMFFVALLLPFWGFLIVLILHFQVAFDGDGSREIGVEKMKLDSELYKSITVEDKKNALTTVPIEEALLINTARERREIIMDVLNDNPKEYIEFLQKAGNNDDTEVVHYAVTAMVEISKENDYMLQQFEKRYAEDPEDFEVLSEYCDFLWNCLEQNLMQGQVEIMNRSLYSDLVKNKLHMQESLKDYIRLTKNALKLKNYTEASAAIDTMDVLWHDSEEYVLLKLQYLADLGRGDEIKSFLDETEREKIYLSAAAKEAIAFWRE